MGFKHTAGMVILGGLLLAGVVGSNFLVGLDRTVLDADFATETLDEEQVYDTAIAQIEDRIAGESGQVPVNVTEILDREYIQGQTETNIKAFYDYLHGRNDTLILGIDTSPLQGRLAEELEQSLIQSQLAENDPRLARMTENESMYLAEREAFRQEQFQDIQQATDENLSQQELETAYAERKDIIRQQFSNQSGGTGETTPLQQTTRELIQLKGEGLINESLTYSGFMDRFNDTIDRLATLQAERALETMGSRIPESIEVTDELSAQQQQRLETVRSGISLFSLLVIILPLLSLGLAGLMWYTAGSRSGALLGIGHVIALGGLVTTVAVAGVKRFLVPRLREEMASDAPSAVTEVGIGIFEQFLDAFLTQSFLIILLGGIILVAGLVVRHRDGTASTASGDRAGEDDGEDPAQGPGEKPPDEELDNNERDSKPGKD